MASSKENQEAHEPLLFLPVRWFSFFRLHPHSFLEPTYLFSISTQTQTLPNSLG